MMANRIRMLLSVAMLCNLPCIALAQQPATMAAADALFAGAEWDKAATAYAAVTAAEPGNGLAWQNRGEALLQSRKFEQAAQAFGKASALKFRPLVNIVNVARVHAEKGERLTAMQYLEQVVATGQGGRVRTVILGAPEFGRYKDDAQFKSMVEAMAPCRTAPYRQFDFWVGDWQVEDPAKNVVGKNRVTREQDGCLILENWTSATGGQTGSSFNYYDVRDQKWHQLYIDNSGNAGAFPAMAGEFRDGKMVLISDEKASPVFRWTWTAITPGRVRQMAEQSTDGQQTWQVTWDSYYVRKP